MNSWDLKGKRALVTGGSKGIGKAVVKEFLNLGAEVLFSARNADVLASAAKEFLQMGHAVHSCVADVGTEGGREILVEWMQSRWGSLDILVNNAGVNIHKRTA